MTDLKYLVSREWLTTKLDDPDVIMIDCRFQLSDPAWGYEQYLDSHIPGAYYLNLDQDLSAPVKEHGGRHPLPNPEVLGEKLAALGINFGKTWIVAYDDSRLAFAARLWWLMRYFGHDRVAVLDGGWQGWQGGGYAVTQTIPRTKPGEFVPKPQPDWIVDIETVRACQNLPRVVLVDARDGDRYRGEREPIDPIAGHIPDALNLPWKTISDQEGFLRPVAEQKKLWSDYREKSEIIVYCGSGVTACVNLLSLELAGIKQAKLYPGGWSDWCSYLKGG